MLTLSRTCQCHHRMRHRGDMGHPMSGMGRGGVGSGGWFYFPFIYKIPGWEDREDPGGGGGQCQGWGLACC